MEIILGFFAGLLRSVRFYFVRLANGAIVIGHGPIPSELIPLLKSPRVALPKKGK